MDIVPVFPFFLMYQKEKRKKEMKNNVESVPVKSYRIIRQNLAGQRRRTVANGIMSMSQACDIASRLDFGMDECEMRGARAQEEHVVEEE